MATLLGVADVLAKQCDHRASSEIRRALERSLRAMCVLREELAMIEVIEQYLGRRQEGQAPPS